MDHQPNANAKSASYCCEAAGTLPAANLPTEAAFPSTPVTTDEARSASYCCEAAGTLPAGDLPVEKPF